MESTISCFKDMCTLWGIIIKKEPFEYSTSKGLQNEQFKSLTRNTSKMPDLKENLAYSALKRGIYQLYEN